MISARQFAGCFKQTTLAPKTTTMRTYKRNLIFQCSPHPQFLTLRYSLVKDTSQDPDFQNCWSNNQYKASLETTSLEKTLRKLLLERFKWDAQPDMPTTHRRHCLCMTSSLTNSSPLRWKNRDLRAYPALKGKNKQANKRNWKSKDRTSRRPGLIRSLVCECKLRTALISLSAFKMFNINTGCSDLT